MLKKGDLCRAKYRIALWENWDANLNLRGEPLALAMLDELCVIIDGPAYYCSYRGFKILTPAGSIGWTYSANVSEC